MHWVFTKAGRCPLSGPAWRLTIVKAFVPVARLVSKTAGCPSRSGWGRLFALLQAASQDRQPMHLVVSISNASIPSDRGASRAARALPGPPARAAPPAAPAILRKVRRLTFI
jgi:hypothetical protein